MEVLRILTLTWAAILVLALAVVLVLVLFYHWRIGTELERVRERLGRIPEASEPLADLLTPLEERMERVAGDLERSAALLVEARREVSAGEEEETPAERAG